MSLFNIVNDSLTQLQACISINDGVAVRTHCLYPSNSSVTVSVRGGGDRYVVMDDGRAFREAETAGARFEKSIKKYERITSRQGLLLENGVVKTPAIGPDMIPMAILLVANVSKELSEELFSTWRPTAKRDFKEAVRTLLRKELANYAVKEEKIVGTSNKPHTFDNVIYLPGNRRVIVDPVLRDANSINSRVVAHIDLKGAKHEGLEQRIIYDDQEKWSSGDLSLLQVSNVPVIAFSKVEAVMKDLLAA